MCIVTGMSWWILHSRLVECSLRDNSWDLHSGIPARSGILLSDMMQFINFNYTFTCIGRLYREWKQLLRHIYPCRTANMSWRTCVVVKQIQSNHVLSTFVDSENELPNFCHSRYVHTSKVQSSLQNNRDEFLILTLNIQSINVKFSNLFPVINNLTSQGLYFGAICLQKTWTSNDPDLSLLQLPW